MPDYWVEELTEEERARLAPYVTNLDRPVFALRNLPETVKGALFARYSRSGKTLRRLFLDEFADQVESGAGGSGGALVGPPVNRDGACRITALRTVLTASTASSSPNTQGREAPVGSPARPRPGTSWSPWRPSSRLEKTRRR
ncbi:MAG TPA: hypothetical protein VFS70_05940, partial [Actinomycetota bacterium]|nr:hypothetical protein [Actinomycetota bacterium]